MGEGDSPIPLHPAHYAKESGLDNIPTKGVIIFPCGQVKTLKTQLHIYTLPTHVRPEIPQENHHVIIMVKISNHLAERPCACSLAVASVGAFLLLQVKRMGILSLLV